MKFIAAVLIVLFAACPKNQGEHTVITLTASDSGKILTIAKGETFMLTLPGHQGGGYRFDRPQYDSTVIQLQKYTQSPPPGGSSLGRPGTGIWQFAALAGGRTHLRITESRPWTKAGLIIGFENTVIVKQQNSIR